MASINAGGAHSEAAHPRKRLKISRNGAKASPAPAETAIMPLTSKSTTNGESSTMAQPHIHDGDCHHEGALKTLHTDVDAMRHLITCSICHRLMYEPYALSCGHTYCYSCLAQWMGSNAKKTCPDCRAVITQQPTPTYVIRELVLIFASRNQLLPDGETSEEHTGMARDEAALVATDRADTDPRTGGLFKGSFNKRGGRAVMMPLHDPGDGVDRCPRCHWEVEDGFCGQCGEPVGGDFSSVSGESIDSDDEVDHDFGDFDEEAAAGFAGGPIHVDLDTDEEDAMWGNGPAEAAVEFYHALGAPAGLPVAAHGANYRNRHGHGHAPVVTISSDNSEGDSESENDERSSDRGFIDDGVHYEEAHGGYEVESDDSDDTEVQDAAHHLQSRSRRRAPVVISDEEDDTDASHADAITIESSDDEAPALRTAGRVGRIRVARSRPVVVSDESDSGSDDSTVQPQPEFTNGGFSPIEETSDDDDESTVPNHVEWTTGAFNLEEQSEDESESEAAPDLHFDHTDATSEASELPPPIYHEQDADESGSEDDSDSENGYESDSSDEAPPTVRTNNNRLQTNVHRRGRYHDALHHQPIHRSPVVAVPSGSRSANRHATLGGAPAPPQYQSRIRRQQVGLPAPNHPFQLDNTLASIRDRSGRQQRNPSFTSEDTPDTASSVASSESSATGGVDVQSEASQQSISSSDSSRTIGRAQAAQAQSLRQQGKRPLNLGGNMPWGYDGLRR